jgi:hypothetical protein
MKLLAAWCGSQYRTCCPPVHGNSAAGVRWESDTRHFPPDSEEDAESPGFEGHRFAGAGKAHVALGDFELAKTEQQDC